MLILIDFSLSRLQISDVSKVQKWAFGPNQFLKKLLQLAQTVYYGREYEEENKRQKRSR